MKISNRFAIAPPVIGLILLLATQPASAYQILLRFIAADPAAFPVGRMVNGDLSNASQLNFADFDPFFELQVDSTLSPDSTVRAEQNPTEAYLLCRFESTDRPLFTVTSSLFPVSAIYGRWLNNNQLARIPSVSLGGGGEEISANNLLPYIDGGMLKAGLYTLTMILAETADWDQAMSHNMGIASFPVMARNTNQITILEPGDAAQESSNPIFLWSFPRSGGISFHLDLVAGQPNDDPQTAIESANQENIYASIDVPNSGQGGEFSAYSYTGTGGERPLTAGATYFWRVTAHVQTMFPGETQGVLSPVYRFTFSPAGGGFGGGAGGGGGGGGAGLYGGQGGEGGGNPYESPIFTFFRRILTEQQYQAIVAQFPNPTNWSLTAIRVDGINSDANTVARLLLEGNRHITSVTVQ